MKIDFLQTAPSVLFDCFCYVSDNYPRRDTKHFYDRPERGEENFDLASNSNSNGYEWMYEWMEKVEN